MIFIIKYLESRASQFSYFLRKQTHFFCLIDWCNTRKRYGICVFTISIFEFSNTLHLVLRHINKHKHLNLIVVLTKIQIEIEILLQIT